MSLIGKRQTRLLVLMLTAAVALAAVLIAGSTPANAAKPLPPCDFDPTTPDPLCLVITDVSPDPGATNVPLSPGIVEVTFNQAINNVENLSRMFRVENVATGENVPLGFAISPDGRIQALVVNPQGSVVFECGTTYEATVGGRGSRAVTSLSGLPLLPRQPASGDIVTFEKKGTVTWTFTTVACPQP